MSVKVHEAFSLDSFQDRLLFFDDFHGDQLQDEWATVLVGGATVVVVDAQTGGIVRLIAPTNASADQATLYWGNIRSLHVDQKVTWEARVRFSSVVDFDMTMGLYFDAQNRIQFRATTSNLRLRCENNNIETNPNTTTTLDTDWHIYRIECFPTDEVHFYYDGVEVTNSPITTDIPDDAADFLQPWFDFHTNAAAEKQMDIDYVYIRQERT